MSVQVKGSGTIGGLDEGLVVSGIVTASTQINVGSNIKIGTAGVVTATTFSGSGASLTNLNASAIASGTVPTARLGSGTASSSTFLAGDSTYKTVTGTTINNNANNRIITGSGTANTLEAESTLTFNGNTLNISGSSDDGRVTIVGHEGYDARLSLIADQGDDHIDQWNIRSKASNNTLTIDQFGGGTFNTRLTIASDQYNGNVTVNTGNLIIGTSGKGIDFSATSDASGKTSELLDDYEEGSFTPQFDGLSNTPVYAVRNGRYTKIGRYVHITGIIQTGGTNPQFTTTSDILKITGLPYAGSGVIYYVSVGNVSQQHWSWAGSGNNEMGYSAGDIDFFNCQMEHNTSTMIFVLGKGGNTRSRVRNASMHNSGAIIIFELSYTTT